MIRNPERKTFRLDHHGTSGTWYPLTDEYLTMYAALQQAEKLKAEGYGVRIVRGNGTVAMSAPYQEPVDWSIAE